MHCIYKLVTHTYQGFFLGGSPPFQQQEHRWLSISTEHSSMKTTLEKITRHFQTFLSLFSSVNSNWLKRRATSGSFSDKFFCSRDIEGKKARRSRDERDNEGERRIKEIKKEEQREKAEERGKKQEL